MAVERANAAQQQVPTRRPARVRVGEIHEVKIVKPPGGDEICRYAVCLLPRSRAAPSRPCGDGCSRAAPGALCGSAIYFPKLQLEMPLLPDMGFEDLRKYDYAEPFLTMEAVQALQGKKLDWLQVKKNLRFRNWEGDGGMPQFMKERYPDK